LTWGLPLAKYHASNQTTSNSFITSAGVFVGRNRTNISSARKVADSLSQIFAESDRRVSPRARQLRICSHAPNTGVNTRLQLAVAFGFQSGGASPCSRIASSTTARGGA